jgi:quinol monooxygenase YgiN
MPPIDTTLSRRTLIAGGLAGGILPPLPAQSQTGSPTMKPTIGLDSAVTTLVSVFTLRDPANQPKLVALLQEGVELYGKIREGGMLATVFLKSRDGNRVIGYSQWRDAAAIDTFRDAFRKEPQMTANMQNVDALATREGFICDVIYSLRV